MARIAIIFGGQSTEHEVSLSSAAAVLANLSPEHNPLLIGVSRENRWYLQDTPKKITGQLEINIAPESEIFIAPGCGLIHPGGKAIPVDFIFPMIHGSGGEDGCLQGILETINIPYAGSPISGSVLGMDKDLVRRLWEHADLPVAKWRCLYREEHHPPSPPLLDSLFANLGPVLFIKPARSGSSVGVSQCRKQHQLAEGLEKAWKYDNKILVEKEVQGREIECTVIGNENPRSFPPGEIITPSGFYDYNAKYIKADSVQFDIPARLDPETARKIDEIARKACLCIEVRGFARVDFFLETSGKIYLNEINTIPGMTAISLFPRMAARGGLTFPDMLKKLMELGMEEHRKRNRNTRMLQL